MSNAAFNWNLPNWPWLPGLHEVQLSQVLYKHWIQYLSVLVQVNRFREKGRPDRRLLAGLELLAHELERQRGLAHCSLTQHHQLEPEEAAVDAARNSCRGPSGLLLLSLIMLTGHCFPEITT